MRPQNSWPPFRLAKKLKTDLNAGVPRETPTETLLTNFIFVKKFYCFIQNRLTFCH